MGRKNTFMYTFAVVVKGFVTTARKTARIDGVSTERNDHGPGRRAGRPRAR